MSFLPRFLPDLNISRRDIKMRLPWVVRNGLASQVMETLTLGPFLVAYALEFGASNLMIGVLAAIPHFAQLTQLPGIYLVERFRARRAICAIAGTLSRPMYLILAMAAFLPSDNLALGFITIAILVRYSLGGVVSSGWYSWVRDIVPEERRGRFFANRLMRMTLMGMAVSLAAAWFVDFWQSQGLYSEPLNGKLGYSILFLIAFVAGMVSIYCMLRMPEPLMDEVEEDLSMIDILIQPFRDINFRRLLYFLGSWNFAVNLAAPFFTVYLLRRLNMDLSFVVMLTLISQGANVLVLRTWGRIADSFSNKSVLAVAAPMFILSIFAWTFTTLPEVHILTVPLLVTIHVVMGIATAGVTLASGNIGMKLAPSGSAASYLSVIGITNALAAGIAPIIGGASADLFVNRELSFILQWNSPEGDLMIDAVNLRHWDFFFLFAALIGMYSIHRLALVRETGEVHERIVLNELLLEARRTVRNFSTVSGLRAMTDIPLEGLRRSLRRQRLRHAPGDRSPRSDAEDIEV